MFDILGGSILEHSADPAWSKGKVMLQGEVAPGLINITVFLQQLKS